MSEAKKPEPKKSRSILGMFLDYRKGYSGAMKDAEGKGPPTIMRPPEKGYMKKYLGKKRGEK